MEGPEDAPDEANPIEDLDEEANDVVVVHNQSTSVLSIETFSHALSGATVSDNKFSIRLRLAILQELLF